MYMRQTKNCDISQRWDHPISQVATIACGLLFCLTTSVFASEKSVSSFATENIENVSPDQVGRTVTITVSDNAGPVIGANVVVKGTTNGNISDMNGKVTLQNVPRNATLVISYIGYATQEIVFNNQRSINVTMSEDIKTLQ